MMRGDYQTLAPDIDFSALECAICGFECVELTKLDVFAIQYPEDFRSSDFAQ
jgi:hypothetical protein